MFLKYNWKAILWALFILFLCGLPGGDVPHFDLMDILSLDKLGHAAIFLVLVRIGASGLSKQYDAQGKRSNAVLHVLFFALAYGALTEWMQGAVFVDRSADIFDMLANWAGSLIGMYLYKLSIRRRSDRKIASNT